MATPDPLARSQRVFDRLFDTHRRGIHAFVLGRSGDPDAALDLLQETFVRVWRNVTALASMSEEHARAWIYAAARSACIDGHRRRQARGGDAPVEPIEDLCVADGAPDPLSRALANDEIDRLEAALSELPVDLREPLVMQAVGGMTSGEIGRALGVPSGTVRYRISMARRRLAERLALPDSSKEASHAYPLT